MASVSGDATSKHKPLRVWPGVILAVALLAARFGVKAVVPGFTGFSRGMMWSFYVAGAVLLWWLLLSRARWFERLGGVALIAAGLYASWQLRHPSMSLLWLAGYAVPRQLDALLTLAPRDHLHYGSDYPFTPEPVAAAAAQRIDCHAELWANTERLFPRGRP